jgi:hypothetical protein
MGKVLISVLRPFAYFNYQSDLIMTYKPIMAAVVMHPGTYNVNFKTRNPTRSTSVGPLEILVPRDHFYDRSALTADSNRIRTHPDGTLGFWAPSS